MNIRSAKELGALIRSRRQQCDWTQADLAERAGVSALWVSQLERGKKTAQFVLVLQTLKVLGLDLSINETGVKDDRSEKSDGNQVINLDEIIEGQS